MSLERAVIKSYLAQVEQAARLGREHLDRQIEIVADLEKDGHDTHVARHLLRTFEDVQAEHEAHRDRLRAELRALARPGKD